MPPPQYLPVRLFSRCQRTATPQPGSSSCFLSASLWPRHTVASTLGTNLREGQGMMVSVHLYQLIKLYSPLLCAHMWISTLVVMPNSYFPDAAQAGVRGDMKDIEGIAWKSTPAVEMAVTTTALASIQTNSHMGRGAWRWTQTHYINDFYKFWTLQRLFFVPAIICCNIGFYLRIIKI